MNLENFLFDLEKEQQSIISFLNHEFLNYPEIQLKKKFRIPFYYYKTWLCYLNPLKKVGVELCFIEGQIMSDPHGILESKGRKKIKGVSLYGLKDLPYDAIMECFAESIIIDKEKKSK